MNEPLSRSAGLVAAVTAALLLVPAVAMRFTDEVAWGSGDFAAAAVLLFAAGLALRLIATRLRSVAGRAGLGALVLLTLLLAWAELAVGLFD